MIKLILATLFLYACYALYQQFRNRVESQQKDAASNKRNGIDPGQAVEAEYRVIEDAGRDDENG